MQLLVEQRKKFTEQCKREVMLRKEKSRNPKHAKASKKAKLHQLKVILKQKSLKEAIVTGQE